MISPPGRAGGVTLCRVMNKQALNSEGRQSHTTKKRQNRKELLPPHPHCTRYRRAGAKGFFDSHADRKTKARAKVLAVARYTPSFRAAYPCYTDVHAVAEGGEVLHTKPVGARRRRRRPQTSSFFIFFLGFFRGGSSRPPVRTDKAREATRYNNS